MRIRLRGKHWDLVRVINIDARGDIDSPSIKDKRVRVNTKVKDNTEELLEVIIHECLHGLVWDLSEETVQESKSEDRIGDDLPGAEDTVVVLAHVFGFEFPPIESERCGGKLEHRGGVGRLRRGGVRTDQSRPRLGVTELVRGGRHRGDEVPEEYVGGLDRLDESFVCDVLGSRL